MNPELKHLLLTKVGIFIALAPFAVAWYVGDVRGVGVVVFFGTVMAGSALWGYSYGWLSGHGGENDE